MKLFIYTFSRIFKISTKILNNWFSAIYYLGIFHKFHPRWIHNHEVPSSILGPATNLKGSFRGTYEEIRKCFFRIIFDLGNTEGTQTILFFTFLFHHKKKSQPETYVYWLGWLCLTTEKVIVLYLSALSLIHSSEWLYRLPAFLHQKALREVFRTHIGQSYVYYISLMPFQ